MANYQNPQMFTGMPHPGPGTKWLCIVTLATSLIGAVTQRKMGFGVADLTYNAQAVLNLELWRVFTYTFVEHQPFALMLSLLVLWLLGGMFESRWGTRYFLQFFLLSAV